ncbi:hypothetical protein HanHA300_Chr10g0348201 [Helianthus annuus]|nr:hypothetical protein HanHA300_Chr10g0348201 [Helianthus annuus]KAJ0520198.1 hypothetical protein HanIR_Chr10g0456711 [Helianthus annuus]KAJ0695662.1 hypothetical protein HanLR1_Chr10g0348031 [Helianthus annuus]
MQLQKTGPAVRSKEHLQGSLARKFELRELPYELGCYRDKA